MNVKIIAEGAGVTHSMVNGHAGRGGSTHVNSMRRRRHRRHKKRLLGSHRFLLQLVSTIFNNF